MSRHREHAHAFSLPFDRAAVFALFSDPRYLDLLTPPWFRLRPLDKLPASLRAGVKIPYRLRWRGLPLRWTSLITEWQAPDFFAYEQERGPYGFFRHEHAFSDSARGTRVTDRVLFRGPGGGWTDRWLALPDLQRIFLYRERVASSLLSAASEGDPTLDADGRLPEPAALVRCRQEAAERRPRTSASSSPIERPT